MPHTETVIRIFVASPGDVVEERADLEEVIRELNATWSRHLGKRLDLLKWETQGFPGVGADPQAVINEEIGDDYDIFIGIFHTNFGTPTKRAGSGTEEEFARALERYRNDPNSLRIMFYFKDAPIAPSKIDPEQIAKVKKFKNDLGPEGVLWWQFNNRENFQDLARLHLSLQVQNMGKTWAVTGVTEALVSASKEAIPANNVITRVAQKESEEEGFIDLVEKSVEEFNAARGVSERLAQATAEMGARVSERAKELAEAENIDQQKRVLTRTAENLDQFASETEAALTPFRSRYSTAVDSYARAATLLGDFKIDDSVILRGALDAVRSLEATFDQAYAAMGGLRESMSRLPRATTNLNKSKRRALAVIDRLMIELANAKTLTSEAAKTMESLIDRSEPRSS